MMTLPDKTFLPNITSIEPVSRQAAQLGNHFYSFHNTQLEMNLFEGPDQGYSTGEGKWEKIEEENLSTRRDSNPGPPDYEAIVLQLCYNQIRLDIFFFCPLA